MSDSSIIELTQVSKEYALYGSVGARIKSAFFPGSSHYESIEALKDVSISLKKGEFVGIIGRNGSGKSTLLELICGISEPTRGSVKVSGTISALLELGAGFNPELSGHDNVYLNGNILGLSNAEIDRYFPKIAEFADIGEFLDKPVKIYSSGMYVRLAFAVQACIEPDILIVDEALAVGDIFFRQKCYQYIEQLISKGTTVILVTHSMGDIEQFCSRVLLLDQGKPVFFGDSSEAVKRYYLINQPSLSEKDIAKEAIATVSDDNQLHWPAESNFSQPVKERQLGHGQADCLRLAVCDDECISCHSFAHGSKMLVFAEFRLNKSIEVPIFGTELINDRGIIVHGKTTLELGTSIPKFLAAGTILRFRQEVQLDLAPGEYTLTIGLASIPDTTYNKRHVLSHDVLYADIVRLCNVQKCAVFSLHFPYQLNDVQLKHHGIADLPGKCEVQIANENAI